MVCLGHLVQSGRCSKTSVRHSMMPHAPLGVPGQISRPTCCAPRDKRAAQELHPRLPLGRSLAVGRDTCWARVSSAANLTSTLSSTSADTSARALNARTTSVADVRSAQSVAHPFATSSKPSLHAHPVHEMQLSEGVLEHEHLRRALLCV